ncbi:expressed unknown protein [Seminavis robusta]|uniref:MYND-type domain-containing protein n=1 Tax=Seminavis robusta TaxID=568900 RepID=A0A9N8HHN1_9STRA|nr:expressed unknown protein [Seminavis robusta]|eukprot:Sro719_g192420.1 n/a (500) ;mRNA; f:42858-44357
MASTTASTTTTTDTSSGSADFNNLDLLQVGNDRKNPHKYIFRRTDFRRLPRWPNDGIDQENSRTDRKHFEFAHPNAEQQALTELFDGCWIYGMSLADMDDDDLPRSMPYLMQAKAAKATGDPEAAKQHLIKQYQEGNRKVRKLLGTIECKDAIHKSSRDPLRFPGVSAILYPLFNKNLASEANIERLFGDIKRVLSAVLEVGVSFAQPPPPNSPAGALRSAMLQPGQVAAADKECANCETKGDYLTRCAACKTIHYCCKECQRADWILHRPNCFEAQGKEVTERMLEKAKAEYRRRQADERKAKMTADAQYKQKLQDSFVALANEPVDAINTYSKDCDGHRRRVDLPFSAPFIESCVAAMLELQYESELSLGMFPDGIDHEKYSGRGALIRYPSNGAKLIILHERLFEDGDGNLNGHALEGIFVVHKVNRKKNRAVWRMVTKPNYRKNQSRLERFQSYLEEAKGQAMPVPEEVDLGIHNPGDFNLTFVSTPFGDHCSIE